ncbi:MAG: hypothetical protein H7062_10480 [Candidatus Saccharimonas sp.]|nr:hypothetical protein [Planctomycetaceae bacterium]
MMASRVTLLLLVTGLFAGMWSGDRADERSANERLLARKAASSSVALRPSVHPNQTAVRPVTRHRGERSLSSIPLPQGIAAGTYLIVDGRGRTETRVVTAAEAFPSGQIAGHVAADQYTVRVGHDRWHFIRLEESANSMVTRRSLSLSRTGPERAASQR